jgi:HlyD family secretion protein
VKTGPKIVIILAVVVAVAGAGVFLFRGKLFPSKGAAAGATTVSVVKVAKGDITSSISASGKLEPNTITTIRPDSNMPTRKLVKILVKEGERVKPGQALAQVDPSGLDLDLRSAQATYESQRAKLDNLKAKPSGLDSAQAEADLMQAKITFDTAQDSYDNTKALVDKGLASKSQLTDSERQLSLARARFDSSQLSYQSVKSQSQNDVVQAQEASFSQSDSALQKAKLVWDSVTIRSPVAGMVAEITVNVGDLVGPSTAMMTVVDPDPMILQAQVNENDMVQVKIGQKATVTPSGYPDMLITGTVKNIDLKAATAGNVSVFQTSIQIPNRDGKLLWGMNADAEISVLSLKGVLTLPTSAVKTSNGASQVTIIDAGQLIAWDVQTGATDGSKIEILAGLDEGSEVVVQRKAAATGSAQRQGNAQGGQQGGGDMGAIFRVLR